MKSAISYRLSAISTIAILMLGAVNLRAQESGIEVGMRGPAAVVETLDGKAADLAQYVGKTPVLLEFWATWCSSCKELEPQIKALHRKYGKQIKFVGVAVSVNQSPALVKRYVERHRMPGDQLYDRRGHATGAYDVPATSYIVILDRAGKVVYTGLGGDQKLEGPIRKALN
ncbi:MAG: TlpA family protein disulfide reductase [Gemmatimonadota bacterium]|nr:TlpA family protein disulfide reductase [Gemmatimonadota bacterium]